MAMLLLFLSMLETPEEKQKFAELYEAYRGLMFSVARDILRDDYLAEDAVNQAFLKLIRHFAKFEKFLCNQTRNYLVIMVRNTSIDMYNSRRKIVEVSFGENHETDDGYEDDSFAVQMDYDEMLDAIAGLPKIYKEALYLSSYLGLSINEIASSLNLSVSAVKQRLMRARLKLRAMLEGEDAK
jgi:RNA polymerase sigma-70 factor (ECF subfamily)